jgi:hypothetical protein
MHPERAALISQSSPEHAPKPSPLFREEETARKTRMNNDLISFIKRPGSANTQPCVQGIGLYTHVAAPTQAVQNPVFLPIGGPTGKRAAKEETVLEAPISEEVEPVWKEIQEALKEEEKHTGQSNMSAEQLKQRYGGLDLPEQQTSTAQQVHLQLQLQKFKEIAQRLEAVRRRSSTSGQENAEGVDQQAELAANISGTGPALSGRTHALPSRSNTTTSISEYHENDDPRKRRR